MNSFDPPIVEVREAVERALGEDLDMRGDITTVALSDPGDCIEAQIVTRCAGVLAGTLAFSETFAAVDPEVVVTWHASEGDEISAAQELGRVQGSARSVLAGERTALNLLGHLSGVATLTRAYVQAAGPHLIVRDTRKTLPGLRLLEKAAVRAGGGSNHRLSLSDAILVKDNHLVLCGGDIGEAIARLRIAQPGVPIEVECDSISQVRGARDAGADLVLLDNMTPADVITSVAILEATPAEISGGITLANIASYSNTGARFVAIGALTHSAPSLDIGLDAEVRVSTGPVPTGRVPTTASARG